MATFSAFIQPLVFSLFIVAWHQTSHAADLVGFAESVVDGEEFVLCIAGACQNIRLCGIETPSAGNPGHEEAITALSKMVLGERILCRPVGEGSVCDGRTNSTSRGRLVAQCFVVKSGADIAGTLVDSQLACDRVHRSGGYYSKDRVERQCPLQ